MLNKIKAERIKTEGDKWDIFMKWFANNKNDLDIYDVGREIDRIDWQEQNNFELILYTLIKCQHCGKKHELVKYHQSYSCPIKHINGVKEEGQFLLTCPSCKKETHLRGLDIIKKE